MYFKELTTNMMKSDISAQFRAILSDVQITIKIIHNKIQVQTKEGLKFKLAKHHGQLVE